MRSLTFRFATPDDIPLLADANAQLIDDEGYEWKLSRDALASRWNYVLRGNRDALGFWKALGFAEYAVLMELRP